MTCFLWDLIKLLVLQMVFYHTYWDIVGNDVWEMVAQAFVIGNINPSLAETPIIHISKVDQLLSLRNFRPISLCNVLLKVVSKVPVHRIRPHLSDFIGPFQSNFTPRRGTIDNALIAQEIIHHMHNQKDKEGYVLFKIGFEKTYDKVDWNFLRLTLA